MNPVAALSPSVRLHEKTKAFVDFLWKVDGTPDMRYEVFDAQMQQIKSLTREVEMHLAHEPNAIRDLQKRFQADTDAAFQRSALMTRARCWPLNHVGDYEMLDAVYRTEGWGDSPGVGRYLDRYFLSSTLAVAVRSRLRMLSDILNFRADREPDGGNWLNLACGSCRELCSVAPKPGRKIWCVDTEPLALEYAENLLQPETRVGETLNFVATSAFSLLKPQETLEQFGKLTTVYSVGLFDYIKRALLVRLLRGLYQSLAEGGVLIASFKDQVQYDTFDYHWLVKWSDFYQRTESECFSILCDAGVPPHQLTAVRDETGVIIFFLATRGG